MKKDGFTLIELLAVIVILALLITIAVPNVIKMSSKLENNMFCEKIETIEKSAQMWGDDNFDYISSIKKSELLDTNAKNAGVKLFVADDDGKVTQSETFPGKTTVVTVKELVQRGYLKKDEENPEDGKSYIVDPRDNSSIMDKNIAVYLKNSRVYAQYQYKDEQEAQLCSKKK